MAESVKITNLPAISALTPNDILPVVDESETQTSRATISQIQALGPGANTVSEDTIQDGAVTNAKQGFSSTDLIVYAGVSQTTGGVHTGEETTLTAFGRELIACANSTEARAALNDSPEFYNGIFVGPGVIQRDPEDFSKDVITPSISFIAQPGDSELELAVRSTGFYSAVPGEFGFSSIGREIFSLRADGSIHLRQFRTPTQADPFNFEDSTLVRGRLCTAYAIFNPGQGQEFISLQSSRAVGEFFGVAGTLAWNESTGYSSHNAAAPYGVTWTAGTQAAGANNHVYNTLVSRGYQNIYAQKNDPSFYSWTGIFYNYHSPEDNHHYYLTSGSGTIGGPRSAHPKTANPWIGAMTFEKAAAPVTPIRMHNITSMYKGNPANDPNAGFTSNDYTFEMTVPMPDEHYTVAASATEFLKYRVVDQRADRFTVRLLDFSGAALDNADKVYVSIFR